MTYFSQLHLLSTIEPILCTEVVPFQASVAILVNDLDEICMIRRATKEGDYWSGHMGFPGGRKDTGDLDLFATAIRETEEEIGIVLQPSECMGRLSDVHYPNFQVACFVFRSKKSLQFVLEESEVANVYWLPLAAFRDPLLRSTRQASYKGQPYETPEVRIGDADVWGISLRMIEDLLQKLDL